MKRLFRMAASLALALATLARAHAEEPWKFGVIADTQWTVPDDGRNPNTVAVDIIDQMNEEFIRRGVDLVVQVGDLTDKGSSTACASAVTPCPMTLGRAALDTRATHAQALYNAGIAFFPLRGNHESSAAAASEFLRIFPQTTGGPQNSTPADALVVTSDDANLHPVAPSGVPFTVGSGFTSSPQVPGLSYSFDHRNVRFVLLDQFTAPDGTTPGIAAQQAWITSALASRSAGEHAFVFSHKGLITQDHADVLFGATPADDPAQQDAFIESLAANRAGYLVLGHDHMHDRSLVTTTGGTSAVRQLVSASDSSKFYDPRVPANDVAYDLPAFGRLRQVPVAQDVHTIGLYLFTVDGPKVTVEYYAVPAPSDPLATTPPLTGRWELRETFGYSLNGKEFLVEQGESYAKVQDAFGATSAEILGGTNRSDAIDGSGRALVKEIDTGWAQRTDATASDVLTLWGLTTVGSASDTYALAMRYDFSAAAPVHLGSGRFGLAARAADGTWVNAVDLNAGGTKRFVLGEWDETFELGTYGFDPASHTAWAVVNHGGDFAVAELPDGGRISR